MKEEYQMMINDCMDRESKMSEWEASFIDSIDEQLYDTGGLSPKQASILNRIWEKCTEGG